MTKEYKINVVHDDSKRIVKTLEYETCWQRDKAYKGLLRNLNMADYTATTVDPKAGGDV